MMDTNTFILIIILISAICFFAFVAKKDSRKIWFKLFGFEAGVETHEKVNASENSGGSGGSIKIGGQNKGAAIGGKGGQGGPGGPGGVGGGIDVLGDNEGFVMAGEGGDAGQSDRSGKGGRGPLQVTREDYSEEGKEILEILDMAGITEEEANKYGKGGDGESSVQ